MNGGISKCRTAIIVDIGPGDMPGIEKRELISDCGSDVSSVGLLPLTAGRVLLETPGGPTVFKLAESGSDGGIIREWIFPIIDTEKDFAPVGFDSLIPKT